MCRSAAVRHGFAAVTEVPAAAAPGRPHAAVACSAAAGVSVVVLAAASVRSRLVEVLRERASGRLGVEAIGVPGALEESSSSTAVLLLRRGITVKAG